MKEFYLKQFYLYIFFFSSYCWSQNIPPTINAFGNQAYCPLTEINVVTSFDIVDPDDTNIEAIYIQISSGYVQGIDKLQLKTPTVHSTISSSWSILEGKLTLKGVSSELVNYTEIIAAVKDVVFTSTSPTVSGEKFFSFTIGEANYLPSNGHYYEFIPDLGITWTVAKLAAENRNYYGLKGYLATLTSKEEAQLAGEQAQGAGWIGGSDAAQEGFWKWVTGPETGTNFWIGLANGSAPSGVFSFWNNYEPNNLGDEDYAHITAKNIGIPGAWNDLTNTGASSGDYQPKGYIVEYGGTPGDPVLDLSASTKIYVPFIESSIPVSNCGVASVALSAIASSGDVLWFDSETALTEIFIGEIFNTPILTTSTTYYVSASENACLNGQRTPISAAIYPVPIINADVTLKNCDEDGNPDGITDFNLNESSEAITLGDTTLEVSYYLTLLDAEAGQNPVNPSPFRNINSNIVFGRAENTSGCYKIATIKLEATTTSFPVNYIETLESCDLDTVNDGFTPFDLTIASQNMMDQFPTGQNLIVQYYKTLSDAQLEENEILTQTNYTNEVAHEQNLFVRVESNDNGECFGVGQHLVLRVNPRPEFDIIPIVVYCTNLSPITLTTYNALDKYKYQWKDENGNILGKDSSLDVSKGGNYTIIATSSFNCESFPKTVFVYESVIANLNSEDITVIDGSDDNSIEIYNQNNNLGIGDYEFSLDSGGYGPYQDETLFENVAPGAHFVYAKDKNGCGIAQQEVFIIGFPKFFTPNNDGVNDTWQVDGVISQPSSKIYIFDKFGKLLQQVDTKGIGWDGYYNGNAMPSSDYWYMVELQDGRIKKGHFSLIRR